MVLDTLLYFKIGLNYSKVTTQESKVVILMLAQNFYYGLRKEELTT